MKRDFHKNRLCDPRAVRKGVNDCVPVLPIFLYSYWSNSVEEVFIYFRCAFVGFMKIGRVKSGILLGGENAVYC